MNYYERLKDLRIKNNLSQTAISEVLEIKQPQYQRYESGARDIPIPLLLKLADFYGVSTDYILGRSDECEESGAENESIG